MSAVIARTMRSGRMTRPGETVEKREKNWRMAIARKKLIYEKRRSVSWDAYRRRQKRKRGNFIESVGPFRSGTSGCPQVPRVLLEVVMPLGMRSTPDADHAREDSTSENRDPDVACAL